MPSFILQEFKRPLGRPHPKMIFTKGEYNLQVKMPGWDRLQEAEPKDHDPYKPPGGNQFVSTYNRIGHLKEDPDHFTTITQQMLEQIKLKHTIHRKNVNKPIVNYLTFHPKIPPRESYRCSPSTAMDYRTTMQTSYKLTKPLVMQRLSMPKIPFLQNRKLRWNDGAKDPNQFYDANFYERLRQFQLIKGFRFRSYDPIHHVYTDGTIPKDTKPVCHKLPFRHT